MIPASLKKKTPNPFGFGEIYQTLKLALHALQILAGTGVDSDLVTLVDVESNLLK